MIDGGEKRNRQLAFELQNLHVCEKRSKLALTDACNVFVEKRCWHCDKKKKTKNKKNTVKPLYKGHLGDRRKWPL